jgi:hypothetical protein
MAGFFVVVALWPVLRGGEPRLWSIVVAAAVGIVAALRPQLLRSANRLWFRFGMLLHKVISPIVLGVLFFMVVTPVGMIMRATGRDVLALSFDRGAKSYWIDRSRDAPGEMNRQF